MSINPNSQGASTMSLINTAGLRRTAIAMALGLAAAGAANAGDMSYEQAINRIGKVVAQDEVVRFHHIYGFQQDHLLKSNQSELAHPDGTFMYKYGLWKGLEGAHLLWVGHWGAFTGYVDWPTYGSLIDHKMAQPVLTVSDDLQHVKAYIRTSADRFFSHNPKSIPFSSLSKEGSDHSIWYKIEYSKHEGIWKMSHLQVCIAAEGAIATGMANLPKAGVLGAPKDMPEDWWKGQERLVEDYASTIKPRPENWRGPDESFAPDDFGCYFAKNQVMIHSVVLPFNFPNPVTGKEVLWKNY
jgi:hypothetical protein